MTFCSWGGEIHDADVGRATVFQCIGSPYFTLSYSTREVTCFSFLVMFDFPFSLNGCLSLRVSPDEACTLPLAQC